MQTRRCWSQCLQEAIALLCAVVGLSATACGDNLTPLPASQPYGEPEIPALACVPNLDGQIDAAELTPAVDVPVRYRVTPFGQTRPVDLDGVVDGAGKRIWDWRQDVSVDAELSVAARRAAPEWFGEHFPADAIAVPADTGATLFGVYRHDAVAFWLHGFASAEENPAEGQTLMVYDAPVPLYRFPIQPGEEWTATAHVVGGTFRGLPYAAKDTYTLAVDAVGEMRLPDFAFQQVIRVRSHVVLQPAVGASATQRQVYFLFECFGEVARATSLPGEAEEDFTTADEVRRLGL